MIAFKRALVNSGLVLEIQGKQPTEIRRLITAVDPDLAALLIIPGLSDTVLRKDYQRPSATSEWVPVITELHSSEKSKLQASKERDTRRMRRDASVAQTVGKGAKNAAILKKRGRKKNNAAADDANALQAAMPAINMHRSSWALRSPPKTIRINKAAEGNSGPIGITLFFNSPKEPSDDAMASPVLKKSGGNRGRRGPK